MYHKLYLISDLNATEDTGLNFGDGFGPFGDSLISSVTKTIFRWQNCFISAALLTISVMQAFRSHHQHFGDELIKAVIDQHVGDFITNFGDGLIPCRLDLGCA